MKKTWEEPKIMVQKFVANEYVAACGTSGVVYNFECNAGEKDKKYAVKDANGNVATISGMYMNGCHFYGPADRPKTIVTKIKEFFGKFFA